MLAPQLSGECMCSRALLHTTPGVLRVCVCCVCVYSRDHRATKRRLRGFVKTPQQASNAPHVHVDTDPLAVVLRVTSYSEMGGSDW